MTAPRVVLASMVAALLAFDLVQMGSVEYAYRAEIARAEEEIGILRRHRADLRAGTQARMLALIGASGVTPGSELARLELRRQATPWEVRAGSGRALPRVYAIARADETIGRAIEEWLDVREGAGDPP